MSVLQKIQAENEMNRLGKAGRPFLFIIDFDQEHSLVLPLDEVDARHLQVAFPNWHNLPLVSGASPRDRFWHFEAEPVDFEHYLKAFEKVQRHLHRGDSYLVNLTFPSKLTTNLSTYDMFCLAEAPYRIWWQGHFVSFSPESFIRIQDGKISSFPMKGTIDANLPHSEEVLLADPKEKAEHATIVDLIRNDLSLVARRVRVQRYRYLEKIPTRRGAIWQSSSEISGELSPDYPEKIGEIIFRLLPAGSISGAPKPKTVEIIRSAEGYERGFYTGIAGIFDGRNLDSAVLIRFVEEQADGLYFKSGGGITTSSKVEDEYRELLRKADLPIRPEVIKAGVAMQSECCV